MTKENIRTLFSEALSLAAQLERTLLKISDDLGQDATDTLGYWFDRILSLEHEDVDAIMEDLESAGVLDGLTDSTEPAGNMSSNGFDAEEANDRLINAFRTT